jgi:hypothetical protein
VAENPSSGKPFADPAGVASANGTASKPGAPGAMSGSFATPLSQPTVKCPKCGTAVREVARFCQRCHNTMRFECPACRNSQRSGGKCEKCGVDFMKYIGAVVAAKQAESDAIQDKFEQRSTFMKNLLVVPFTGGLSLIRQLLVGRGRKS